MKTKHILLGLSLGLLGGFTACDVTDLNPKDSITDNSYWNTCLLYTSPSPRDA